jgi:hypothetical protein
MLSSRQTPSTLGHNSLSLSEGDRKVIRFCSRGGAPRREPRSATWGTTGDSPAVLLRNPVQRPRAGSVESTAGPFH